MKPIFLIPVCFLCISSCKKNSPAPPVNTASCTLTKVITNPGGGSSVIEYSTGGQITGLKNYAGNVLQLSTTVNNFSTETRYTSSAGFPMVQTMSYEGGSIVSGQWPTVAYLAQQEGLITRTRVFSYGFEYDNKGRLNKVIEQTEYVVGDWEYNVYIFYNDQDNVTGLRYEWTTGPNTATSIAASGYDDKKNPYSEARPWKYIISWDASDPISLFAQLSKNNPLGYTIPGGLKKSITYQYNDKGYPITQTSVNTVNSGSAPSTFVTNLEYQCK